MGGTARRERLFERRVGSLLGLGDQTGDRSLDASFDGDEGRHISEFLGTGSKHLRIRFFVRDACSRVRSSSDDPLHEFDPIAEWIVGTTAIESFERLVDCHLDPMFLEENDKIGKAPYEERRVSLRGGHEVP